MKVGLEEIRKVIKEALIEFEGFDRETDQYSLGRSDGATEAIRFIEKRLSLSKKKEAKKDE